MEQEISKELNVARVMRDDLRNEMDVLYHMSKSLLDFNTKWKSLESHFDSLVSLVTKKQNEAVEAVRVKEEEAKERIVKLRDEKLEEQEKRFRVMLIGMDEERRIVEKEYAEKKMKQVKKAVEENSALREEVELLRKEIRMLEEQCKDIVKVKEKLEEEVKVRDGKLEEQEKRFSVIVKEMDEERRRVDIRIVEKEKEMKKMKKSVDENGVLREEVKLLKKQLETQEERFRNIVKVKQKLEEEREKVERRAAEKEVELKQMKKAVDENSVLREEVKSLKKQLETQEERFKKIILVKRELEVYRDKVERRAADKEKEFKKVVNENIALREEVQLLKKEFRTQEELYKNIIKVNLKLENERELELCDAKMDASQKENELNEMKNVVDILSKKLLEDAAACKQLSDENFELRESVKLLTQQLEIKSQPPGKDEQLLAIQRFLQILTSAGIITICDTMKHPDADLSEESGEDLFRLVKEHIDDHEVATSKISSLLLKAKDKAQDLVLDALKVSYEKGLEDQGSEPKVWSCRILLLEQVCIRCPQVIYQIKEEARKVAVEWITKVENCQHNIQEISRFLQFLNSYDLTSELKDEVLAPLLYDTVIHEGAPKFCFAQRFENCISGYIKTLLKNSQRMKAIEYINAFKLEKRFPVGNLVHEEMNHINRTCQRMLKEGGPGQTDEVMQFEIDSLKELIKFIKDLKFHGKYSALNLEQRLAKLEKLKNCKKRGPSFSRAFEPSKKKRRKLSGTHKLTDIIPEDITNVHPGIGPRTLPDSDSNPCSNFESLKMGEHMLPRNAKSINVFPNDILSVHQESGSWDLCCSNPTSDPKPSREEGQLPGTAQSLKSTSKDTLNVHQESDSMALCCFNPCSNSESLKMRDHQLPGDTNSTDIAPKENLSLQPDTRSSGLCCSSSIGDLKPSRTEESQYSVTAQSVETPLNANANVQPESGSEALCCSKPCSNPNPKKKKKKSKLLGTAEPPKVVPKVTSNSNLSTNSIPNKLDLNNNKCIGIAKTAVFQKQTSKIGSRNAVHSQEIQRAPYHLRPAELPYGIYSSHIFPSIQPSWYAPQELPPPPPQYYQPYPKVQPSCYAPQELPPPQPQYYHSYPEVPTWHYGM